MSDFCYLNEDDPVLPEFITGALVALDELNVGDMFLDVGYIKGLEGIKRKPWVLEAIDTEKGLTVVIEGGDKMGPGPSEFFEGADTLYRSVHYRSDFPAAEQAESIIARKRARAGEDDTDDEDSTMGLGFHIDADSSSDFEEAAVKVEPNSDAEDRDPFHESTPLSIKRFCLTSPITFMSPQPSYQRVTAPGKDRRIHQAKPCKRRIIPQTPEQPEQPEPSRPMKRPRVIPPTPEPEEEVAETSYDSDETAIEAPPNPLDLTTPATPDIFRPSYPGYASKGNAIPLHELVKGDMFVPEEWINTVGGITQKPICIHDIEDTKIVYVRVDQPKLVYYAGALPDSARYFRVEPYFPSPDGPLRFYSFDRDAPLWPNNDGVHPFAAVNIIPPNNHYLTRGSILYFSQHNAICVWECSTENDGFTYFEI